MNLTSQEFQSLDALLTVLTSPLPYFDLAPRVQRKNSRPGLLEIFAVCGNWYDVPHKASVMASAAKQRPSATLLLTGGRAERLTPPEAVKQGGEPLLLQNHLHQQLHTLLGRLDEIKRCLKILVKVVNLSAKVI